MASLKDFLENTTDLFESRLYPSDVQRIKYTRKFNEELLLNGKKINIKINGDDFSFEGLSLTNDEQQMIEAFFDSIKSS